MSLLICLVSKQKSSFLHTADFLRLLVVSSRGPNPFFGCSFCSPLASTTCSIPHTRFTVLSFCLLRWRGFPHTPLNFKLQAWHCQCHLKWYELEFKQVVPSGCCHRGWDHTFILSPWWIRLTLSNSSWLWSPIMKSLKIENGREQRGALIIYWLGRIHTFCKETSFVVFWSIQFSLNQI